MHRNLIIRFEVHVRLATTPCARTDETKRFPSRCSYTPHPNLMYIYEYIYLYMCVCLCRDMFAHIYVFTGSQRERQRPTTVGQTYWLIEFLFHVFYIKPVRASDQLRVQGMLRCGLKAGLEQSKGCNKQS